jgi:hypothetical protein
MRFILSLAALALLLPTGLAAPRPVQKKTDAVTIQSAKDHLDFLVNGKLVGRYNKGATVAKPYFWPLNTADGTPITRGWPMIPAKKGESTDHPHQKSAWFCHGDVIPEGIELKDKIRGVKGVDFWSEAKGHGRIVCTEVGTHEDRDQKPGNHDSAITRNEWQTAGGMKIMDEKRTIHLYSFGKTRLFVFDIDLHASVAPIAFGDTKEGSFGVRVNDAIRENTGKGKLVNAEGKTGMKKCWGQFAGWCDYSGPIDGKVAGIAIFDHPKNPVRAGWHSRDYGLMAANPFARNASGFPAVRGITELFKIPKGEHLKLRYGMLIHPGDAKEGKVADYYQKFVKLEK